MNHNEDTDDRFTVETSNYPALIIRFFLLESSYLMYFLKSLFFFSIQFWIPFVVHGFRWNFLCFLLSYFSGAWEFIKVITVFR